jgi:superfamily II DNA or RNA helicase
VQIDLIVQKENEAYLKISCEKHVAKLLTEFFSFFVPGYQFTPLFKQRLWNGKIYLFDFRTQRLYYGLLKYLKTFCEKEKLIALYENDVEQKGELSKEDFIKFVKTLNLQLQPRDYQLDAVYQSILNKRSLILSPTASGKSLILYMLTRYFLNRDNSRGLLVVPTISLVEQMYSDFVEYSRQDDFDMEQIAHKIYGGKEKDSKKKLVITTWQSIFNLPEEWFENFDFVLGDEAHSFKAKSLTSIMTNLKNADYRIGCTGTLDGTKTHKLVLEGLFGPVYNSVTTKELIEKKQLAQFDIKCVLLKYPEEVCRRLRDGNYQSEIDYIVSCEARNKYIKKLALSMKGNSLVLFQLVEKHGKELYKMIESEAKERKIFFVSGATDVDIREDVRKITENENDAIIVASFGTFSTGINIRNLHNIIFASPSKSRIRNLQSIGRGLRLGDNKEKACLYDIADDFRIGKHTNYTLNHFRERITMYDEQKFDYKIYNVELKNAK